MQAYAYLHLEPNGTDEGSKMVNKTYDTRQDSVQDSA